MSRYGSEWSDGDESLSAPETSAAAFSASLALGIAAVAAVVLGFAVGAPLDAALAAVGAGVVGWSAGALGADENARRAVGSVALVAGASLVAAVFALSARALPVIVAAAFALVAVAFDRFAGLDEDSVGDVSRALIHSGLAVGLFAVLASLAHVFVPGAALSAAGEAFSTFGDASVLFSVFLLELELLFVVLAVAPAVRRLETMGGEGRVLDRVHGLDAVAVAPGEVPRGVWVLVAGTGYLAAAPWGRAAFADFLRSLSALGAVVDFLLRSGVLTVPLGVVALFLAAVFAADVVRRAVLFWLGSDPPATLAAAAGGVALGAVVFALSFVGPLATAAAAAVPARSVLRPFAASYGVGATALGVAAAVLVAVLSVLLVVVVLVDRELVPPAAGGFALGSGLLLLAALLAAGFDAAALVTVGTAGAALLVWDLGENAVDLGRTLGADAETRRAEAVHAAGSAVVVAGGVALAAVSLYVIGPLPVPAGRARLALLCALVAFLALAAVTARE